MLDRTKRWERFEVGETVVVAHSVYQYGKVAIPTGSQALVLDQVNAGFRGLEYALLVDGERFSGVPASALSR